MSEPQGGRKGMNWFYPALLTPDICINANNASHGHRLSHQVTAPINSHCYSKLLPASCMDANVHDDRAQVYTHIPRYPRLFLTIRRRSTNLLLWRQRQPFSTSQVLNTSSISCCFSHLLAYSVNTSSSQHFSTLPAFLVIASVSHISLPTYSVNTSQVLNTSQHFQHFLSSLLFLTSPYLRFCNRSWACWGKHLQYFISFLLLINIQYLSTKVEGCEKRYEYLPKPIIVLIIKVVKIHKPVAAVTWNKETSTFL
jgi:hypothetical protein